MPAEASPGGGTGLCRGSDRGAVAGDGPRYRRPLEHGLHSTLIAMRLGKRLEIDAETASQTYYACLLFYVGCTANADIAAEIFGDHSTLTTYGAPVRFGSRPEMVAGLMRAVAPPGNAPLVRARQLSYGLPRLARDAALQRMLGGSEYAASAIRERAGRAFDPVIARRLADEAAEIVALDEQTSAWGARP